MIKLIATDMDGTLLNDKMQVSAVNAAAIRRAIDSGIEFVIATGRSINEAKPLVASTNAALAFITMNGARVFDESNHLIVRNSLTAADIALATAKLKQHHLYYELMTNQGTFANSRRKRLENIAISMMDRNPGLTKSRALAVADADHALMDINYVADYQPVFADAAVQVDKILAYANEAAVLATAQADLSQHQELTITSSAANNLEVNDCAAQKGIALQEYAQKKSIKLSETMAIGDNLNDESMIKMAKYGVAMANAIPKIKEAARSTTGTNLANGVAQAIDYAIALNQEG